MCTAHLAAYMAKSLILEYGKVIAIYQVAAIITDHDCHNSSTVGYFFKLARFTFALVTVFIFVVAFNRLILYSPAKQ